MKNLYLFAFACGLLLLSCARPCPNDIKAGEVNFSENTLELIKAVENKTILRFENQNGVIKDLHLKYVDVHGLTKIPLEVLCERGDFLDRTTQIRYLEAPTFYMTFASADEMIEINFQASIVNDANTLNGDTILYESFSVWIQDINISASGSITYLSNDRGNAANFSDYANSLQNNYVFVSDTIIEGQGLTDVYYNKDNSSGIRFYYAKNEGVVCFQTMFDTWFLKLI